MKIKFALLLVLVFFFLPASSCKKDDSKKEVEKGDIIVSVHKITNCNFVSQMYITLYKDGNAIGSQSITFNQAEGNNTLDFGTHEYGAYSAKASVAKSCWSGDYQEIEKSVQFTLDNTTVFAEIWID